MYAVDLAGNSWDVCGTDAKDDALSIYRGLALLEAARRGMAHIGIFLTDNPEAGDVQDKLEEA